VLKRSWASVGFTVVLFICTGVWAQAAGSGAGLQKPSPSGAVGDITTKADVEEDWSTPSLKGSDLRPIPPLVAEVDRDQLFVREFVRVQWRDGDPIDLYVIRPANNPKPPVVLYLYSYPSENDHFFDQSFCEFLTKNGVAAVGFVSALTGQRYHTRPMKEWFVSQLPESLATSAHDVQMVLNYLETRGDLDMSNVGMFGDGSGATIAILAASVDARIKALDLLNPWGDWPDWVAKSARIPEKERPTYMKPEWLASVAPLDPLKWLPELKTQSIRVRQVDSVIVTPEAARKKMEAALPPQAKLIRFKDQDEFVRSIADGSGFDWIKAQVLNQGQVQTSNAGGTRSDDASGNSIAK
jgi:hypothetical protein